jgi:hypothetical protein
MPNAQLIEKASKAKDRINAMLEKISYSIIFVTD